MKMEFIFAFDHQRGPRDVTCKPSILDERRFRWKTDETENDAAETASADTHIEAQHVVTTDQYIETSISLLNNNL